MSLRIGTRGSALALAQARHVAGLLGGAELVEITTSGDRARNVGDKSRWVAEIEEALARGDVDLAVHSAKDVPGELPEELAIVGVPPRADARDTLVGARDGARVGTSSLRRRALLAALRPEVEVLELRGNVDTRLRKLDEGRCDALVLARAGLDRLGLAGGAPLDPAEFVPAPGQGTLALEARAGDDAVRAAAEAITDPVARDCLAAERALVRALGASCRTPVGAHATPVDGGWALSAFAGLPDGSEWVRDRLTGPDPAALGAAVAERLLAAGAREILDAADERVRTSPRIARSSANPSGGAAA